MSLLTERMGAWAKVVHTDTPDGSGGYTSEWVEQETFPAAIVRDSSPEALEAMKQGVRAVYTVTTRRAVTLCYHDVIKRATDGLVLRVTSNGTDNATPGSAGLDMRQVRAEEWTYE